MDRPLSAVLIEDNIVVAEALRSQLSLCDPLIRLETFDTLAEGVNRMDLGGVDVAIVDLNLPDARDVEAVTKVRERFPNVPIVVVTGAGEELASKAIHEGAQDYLTKPFESGAWLAKRIRYSVIRHEVRCQYTPLMNKLDTAKQITQETKEVITQAHQSGSMPIIKNEGPCPDKP